MKTKYYVRVLYANKDALEEHLTRSGAEFELLHSDWGDGSLTGIYSVNMHPEDALALKLAIPLVGCLNFHKTLNKLTPIMTKYTFTFDQNDERQFNNILGRLEPDEYTVIQPIGWEKPEMPRESQRQTIIEMESDACLTFRLGMGNAIKIRRERTEAELAEEKALHDANTVTITVKVDGLPPQTP